MERVGRDTTVSSGQQSRYELGWTVGTNGQTHVMALLARCTGELGELGEVFPRCSLSFPQSIADTLYGVRHPLGPLPSAGRVVSLSPSSPWGVPLDGHGGGSPRHRP